MTNRFGLSRELPRKGSRMTAVFDPSLGSFLLAEQLRSGKVVIHERLDALAMLDIDMVREFCLRAGAAWTSSADLAAHPLATPVPGSGTLPPKKPRPQPLFAGRQSLTLTIRDLRTNSWGPAWPRCAGDWSSGASGSARRSRMWWRRLAHLEGDTPQVRSRPDRAPLWTPQAHIVRLMAIPAQASPSSAAS